MISFDEATAIVSEAAVPLGSEAVPLDAAFGRVLAEPVVARLDSPRSDVSAMDGYAVRDEDLAGFPAALRVIGESFAGRGWPGKVGTGECARIFTGAPVPHGADRVVIQENVRRDGDIAIIDGPPGAARHIRARGSDFTRGETLLAAGRLLDPRAVVATAAADVATVTVVKAPRVFIIGTGDELAEPGSAGGGDSAIPESLSFGVAALARLWGAEIAGRRRVADDLPGLVEAAGDALAVADVVVVTGGASVGEKDFAKPMFEPHGLDLLFSKVAIKPGKPVWLGRAGHALVLGLPGNPTSAMVTARLFLAPLLAGLSGRGAGEALRWRGAPLASALKECGPRETFHRAKWKDDEAETLSNQDSGAQRALAEADLLIRQRPGAPAMKPGEPVEILSF